MSSAKVPYLTLSQLNNLITGVVARCADLQNVWVAAELSDVQVKGGHCYMELVAKDDKGIVQQRLRAMIWANTYSWLNAKFQAATGSVLASDIKVKLQLTVEYSGRFGLTAKVVDIDPSFTLGDLWQRRNEILARLEKEGVLELNRKLQWPYLPLRIAVISGRTAAGYGDFVNQLYGSKERFRFKMKLFNALMQGDKCAPSIIQALDRINMDEEEWDCVVIIRGGGATTDFAAFEDYDLAANIAQFPIPVIIGIGHERDITLLDYVANMRVKTPTAAAEFLISIAQRAFNHLKEVAQGIQSRTKDLLSANNEILARAQASLPFLPGASLAEASKRMNNYGTQLCDLVSTCLQPQHLYLSRTSQQIETLPATIIARARDYLTSRNEMIELLSPLATLRRGYSITRFNGHAVTRAMELKAGDIVETTMADGMLRSRVEGLEKGENS